MLEGWARFVHRRRWVVLGASLAMLALSGVLLAQGGDLGDPDTIPSTESGRASRLLSEDLPRATGPVTVPGASFTLVFRSETLAVTDAAYRQAVTDALAPLRADVRVTGVRTHYDTPQPALLSRDGHGMLAFVGLKDPRSVAEAYFAELRSLVRSDILTILATGGLPINRDFDLTLDRDLQRAEVVSLPVFQSPAPSMRAKKRGSTTSSSTR